MNRRLLVGLLISGVLASFVGALSGTLAWYSYSTNASLSYRGTSVYASSSLQIGLYNGTVENPILSAEKAEELNLEEVQEGGLDYLFVKDGSSLDSKTIATYLVASGYGAYYLTPVTSKAYSENEDLTLYNSIRYQETNVSSFAEKRTYAKIPLVFRIPYTDNSTTEYLKDEKIYLTDIPTHTVDGDGSLNGGIRVYVNTYSSLPTLEEVEGTSTRDTSSDLRYLIAPGKDEQGSTRIGGILDMNDDGYYDFDTENNLEYIYGSYTGTPTRTQMTEDSPLDDVNGTGSTEASTFLAKHWRSTKAITSYDGLTFDEADYYAPDDIYPTISTDGTYTGNYPLAITDSETGLGRVDLTIYLEGWDFAITNASQEHSFQLGLEFSINEVQL